MKEEFRQLIDALEVARDRHMIRRALSEFTKTLGYQRFAYLQAAGIEVEAFNNYPYPWVMEYMDKLYSRVDPVVAQAKRLKKAFYWCADDWNSAAMTAEAKTFKTRAIEQGLRSGLTIPVEGSYGRIFMLTLASAAPREKRPVPDDLVICASAVLAIHYKLMSVSSHQLLSPTKVLTPRQSLCLMWASKGLYVPEIAKLLKCSVKTVHNYLSAAKTQLHASNLPHAIAIAKDKKLL
jgi:LuxR family transcriptional activator of conjugal transfer of Ti plasmids